MDDYEDAEDKKPKKGEDTEADLQFEATVKALVDDAIDFIDQEVAPQREQATNYYKGAPFGDEEVGRSQIVMTEVRDVVQTMLPALLRIFCSSETVLEFIPRSERTVQVAEQQTDYVNYLFYVENKGFTVLHSAFKDALVRKTGILHWWVEDKDCTEELEWSGLDEASIALLAEEEGVTLEEPEEEEAYTIQDPETGQEVPAPPSLTVRGTRQYTEKVIRVEAVPPEEYFIARDARSEDDAVCQGRRRELTLSDLVEMGYDEDEIVANGGTPSAGLTNNNEAQARNPGIFSGSSQAAPDPALEKYEYCEAYVRFDKDGDGIAELLKVCTLGEARYVLHSEAVNEAPFAILCPDPEPHTAIGYSIADQTTDLQEIKSSVVRNTLDSLANAIHPRTVVVEGQVNLDDAMNTEVGAIIRTRAPGAVQELTKPFVGQFSLPVLEYIDNISAKRTGITKASQGLDPDVLQSTTAGAVSATVSAAQERIELVARIFAETGLARMARSLNKLACRHIDKPKVIKMRGKWSEVDPRSWNADLDVLINIGLGKGTEAERQQLLMFVAGAQKEAIATAGVDNPLTDLSLYRNTLADLMNIGGFKDVSRHFKNVDPAAVQAMLQGKPKDPATILAEVEQMKAQVQKNEADQKHMREMLKMQLEDDRERDRIQGDQLLKAQEIKAKYGAQIDIAQLEHMREVKRTDMENAIAAMGLGHDHANASRQQTHAEEQAAQEQQLAQRQQGHSEQLAARQHALAEQQAAQGAANGGR